ncbi:family with sequence similarity 170 member A [Phyllostomus discolor]|uniref:Family with sequence similarity 170 member A n=1 Tax=Phyllostomus discolor TaxID=89673 RepID=A0A834EPD1_9CHIR|nr:family with sequence similarity 170 member A [Phyllostomus discolor]
MKRQQKRKHLEDEESQETGEKGGGIPRSQEDAPQLGLTKVAKGCGTGAEEVSSASEYFSCVSSPSKLIHGGTGVGRRHIDPSTSLRGNPGQSEEPGENGRAVRGAWT